MKGASASLMIPRQDVFGLEEFIKAVAEVGPGFEGLPVNAPKFRRDIANRLLPVDLGKPQGRRLNRALDEQAEAVPALGRAGDLAALPEQVRLFCADEALAGHFATSDEGESRLDIQACKSPLEPLMNARVTFGRAKPVPMMTRREDEAVSPIGIVGNKTTTGGTADERAQSGEGGNVRVTLGIAERGRGLGPCIETKDRTCQRMGTFKQRLVEGHVECGRSGAGVEQKPGLG